MTQLLDLVLEAHGGLDRWRTFDTVGATFLSSGGLLPMKGLEAPAPASGAVATIHEQSLLIEGYRRPDWRMKFTPQRVAVETTLSFETRAPDQEEMARRVHETLQSYLWLVCALEGHVAGYAYAAHHGSASGGLGAGVGYRCARDGGATRMSRNSSHARLLDATFHTP